MMAATHDAAREQRHKDNGGARLHVRICRRADEVLDAIAAAYGCTRRDALEGLLLGTIEPGSARVRAARQFASQPAGHRDLMARAAHERLSPAEWPAFLEAAR